MVRDRFPSADRAIERTPVEGLASKRGKRGKQAADDGKTDSILQLSQHLGTAASGKSGWERAWKTRKRVNRHADLPGRLSNPIFRQWPGVQTALRQALRRRRKPPAGTPKVFGVPAIFDPSSTAPATPRQGLGLTATPPTSTRHDHSKSTKNNPQVRPVQRTVSEPWQGCCPPHGGEPQPAKHARDGCHSQRQRLSVTDSWIKDLPGAPGSPGHDAAEVAPPSSPCHFGATTVGP